MSLFIASHPPLARPKREMATAAYSLHVGTNLQEGGTRGERNLW